MYQKIEVATSSQASIPIIRHLIAKNLLHTVLVPTIQPEVIPFFSQMIPERYLRFFDHPKVLPASADADLMISFGYPKKVEILPNIRMINVHYGKLPENKGADPLFRTLASADAKAYITIHEMTEELDSGDILIEQAVDILPGEYYGMLSARLSNLSVSMLDQVISGKSIPKPQDQSKSHYFGPVEEADTKIDWQQMNATEIERLVNACNPKYQGAFTSIMGSPLKISEVSVAQINMPAGQRAPVPGTVIHANAQDGMFVICKDTTFIRLNIISTMDGMVSGNKLAALGTQPGIVLGM